VTNEEFTSNLKNLSKRIDSTKNGILTEEATKMSFIVPLIKILGYDVYDPSEFVPEYVADVGTKKGEKVDYAILTNNSPTILIEAKWCGEELEKHDGQLYRYFSVTKAKFAILTNGVFYRFFTDLDEPNKMDEKPFLEVNMLELKDIQIQELWKFSKEKFDEGKIFDSASEMKYTNSTKRRIINELNNPTDPFVKLIISDIYGGTKTQRVVDDFRIIIKKAFAQYINELISDRLKNALDSERESITSETLTNTEVAEVSDVEQKQIVMSEDKLQAFYIIKSMLADFIPLASITYKNTESYMAILLDGNVRKWICRVKLGGRVNSLILPASNNKTTLVNFENLDELYTLKQNIIESANRFHEG